MLHEAQHLTGLEDIPQQVPILQMNPNCNHNEAQEDPLWCPPIQIHIVLSNLSPQANSAQFQLAEKTARKHKNITE